MEQIKKLNLLIIGNQDWYKQFISSISILTETYNIEYISDIKQANARLWHNSYDILLLEQKFSNDHTIKLTKMSYAMSRPSIIFCNNKLTLICYKLWKHLSSFTNKFSTSKKLIYFLKNHDKQTIKFINDLSQHHQYLDIISKEIQNNF